jgi:hypothetical protein
MAPTLHDIAAMPFPASVTAMRKYHDPSWGFPEPDEGELRTFKVRVDWTVEGSDTVYVKASDAAEAKEVAADQVADMQSGTGEFEVGYSRVEEVDPNALFERVLTMPSLFS